MSTVDNDAQFAPTAGQGTGGTTMHGATRVGVAAGIATIIMFAPSGRGTAAEDEVSPVFGVAIPAGFRDWRVISVAHEAGSLNDLRAILGNEIAVKAYREGTRPFPNGTIIARVAWRMVPSPENNAVFGQAQSFVPGAPTNTQFSVKDTAKYASTGGWGYGQFEDGKPNPSAALMQTCFPCHARLSKADDFVFTRYAP